MFSFTLFLLYILIFIFGMYLLRIGLFNLSGSNMDKWLLRLTNKPWKGMLTGTVITGVLQSSSATMVITIGLITAKSLTYLQSIGIILGTNIGTTITTELITLKISNYTVPITIIGCLLIFLKKIKLRSVGFSLCGLGLIFSAMTGFEKLAEPLASSTYFSKLLEIMNENLFYAIMVGMIFTAIIQSSTVMTGITMGFLLNGVFPLETGIALMLGANIGTCITAYIASIGAGHEAKLCAYAHIWLNIIGVLAFYPLIGELAVLTTYFADSTSVQLAHASVFFNVISSLIMLPFAHQFGKLIIYFYGKPS